MGKIVRKNCDQIYLQLTYTCQLEQRCSGSIWQGGSVSDGTSLIALELWMGCMSELRPLQTLFPFIYIIKVPFCTVLLLALVDADYRFFAIYVGSYVGNSNEGIFADFALGPPSWNTGCFTPFGTPVCTWIGEGQSCYRGRRGLSHEAVSSPTLVSHIKKCFQNSEQTFQGLWKATGGEPWPGGQHRQSNMQIMQPPKYPK